MARAALQIIRDEHTAVAAVLRSILAMVDTGPGDHPERFFDVLRAMLFYIDEFPERRHHPKETELLFPKVVRAVPQLALVIERLDNDHLVGEGRVRELQHLLLAWELLGDSRRKEFTTTVQAYVRFYLDHMHVEEQDIIPAAIDKLTEEEWEQIDAAFMERRYPLVGGDHEPTYDRLFTRIVLKAPAPIGVGPELTS